jgi:hypothetical protein
MERATQEKQDEQAELPPSIRRPAVRSGCIVLGTTVPLIISLTFALQNFVYPTAVYRGEMSDHFSHIGATLMFLSVGLDVYRKPVNEILKPVPPESPAALPENLKMGPGFINPLNAAAPAIAVNFEQRIRAYPPGLYVLYFPIAMLYQFRLVSFIWACRIIILGFVLTSAAISFILWSDALFATDGWALAIKSFTALLITFWCDLWALQGEYDVTALLLVVSSLTALKQRAWINAILFFCLAAFLHSRALYASPIALIAMWNAWCEDPAFLKRWLREPKIWIAAAALGACLMSLVIALPQVRSWPSSNIYRPFDRGVLDLTFVRALGIALAGILALALLWSRDFGGLLMLLCPWAFMLETPEVQLWHSIFWLPLLVYCSFNLKTTGRRFIWLVALSMVAYLTCVVYGVAFWLFT